MDVLFTALGFLLGIFVPHWLIAWDERRLEPAKLARAWSWASHWAAVLAFSFFCIPVHFAKTRRSMWGALLGFGWMLLAAVVTSLVLEGLAGLFGV